MVALGRDLHAELLELWNDELEELGIAAEIARPGTGIRAIQRAIADGVSSQSGNEAV